MFSEDQSYRGIGAVISYNGCVLRREKGLRTFKGAKWAVYDLHHHWLGAAYNFAYAKRIADSHAAEGMVPA